MATVYEIFAGSAATASLGPTLLGTASAGTQGASRVLTHPDSDNFPPIVYPPGLNPTDTINLDNDVLLAAHSSTVLTLGSRRTIRNDGNLVDQIVTEKWDATGRNVIPTFFFRLLYEYWANPPAYDPIAQTYITYQPADRNAKTYNVELFALGVGGQGTDPKQQFRINDQINYLSASESVSMMEAFDAAAGGFFSAPMVLQMKMVGVVA